jgi:FlaA1/EpsC-like NDP-sugar epimerase
MPTLLLTTPELEPLIREHVAQILRGLPPSADRPTGPVEILSITQAPTPAELAASIEACAADSILTCLSGALAEHTQPVLSNAGLPVRAITPFGDGLTLALTARRAAQPAFGRAPEIDLASLVGRTPWAVDAEQISGALRGRTVLITGAGGSIGSELVRVVSRYGPGRIVLMERAENALFEIDRWLAERCPAIARTAHLHDVCEAGRTLSIVRRERPDVVFHAAAHKHVPLMEDHPAHAVTNNVFGTVSIADAAQDAGAERFVLISTDKAVRPASVMGATKLLAERYVRTLARMNGPEGTRFSMVRFGNVLGSAGSVLTIWASQLAAGRPITLTDPRMTRYFMTIPEAAALVTQASAMSGTLSPDGAAGEVFVLDMGQPVRIAELAARFVRAHGLEPGRDATITCTGARPGEKLDEQLAHDRTRLAATPHPGVLCLPPGSDTVPTEGEAAAMLAALDDARRRDAQALLRTLTQLVPDLASARAMARGPELKPETPSPAMDVGVGLGIRPGESTLAEAA